MSRSNFDTRRVSAAAKAIEQWAGDAKPTIAVTLGSGLGGFGIEKGAREISYTEVGLHTPDAANSHAGVLRLVQIGAHWVLILDGRIHFYEGYGMQNVVLAVRAAAMAGAMIQIITCAAGGLYEYFRPGEIAVIRDHINLMGDSPLRGIDHNNVGARFPSMQNAYDPQLRSLALAVAREPNVGLGDLREVTHCAVAGPCYETPAEAVMERLLGAHTCGMSTVPEVIALRHMGARVLGLACVSNHAANIAAHDLNHKEVTQTGANSAAAFRNLLQQIIKLIPV